MQFILDMQHVWVYTMGYFKSHVYFLGIHLSLSRQVCTQRKYKWQVGYIYVISWLGGLWSEKLWPRSWKCCPGLQAKGSISSPRSQFFTVQTDLLFSCGKLIYRWFCLSNFVIESAYVPSTNLWKKSLHVHWQSNSDTRQRKMY